MLKASAQSPELVQMLLVAFSRRICCSRVDRVSTKPRLPFGIDGLAAQPPRHLADEFLAGEQADVRSAELQSDADRLALADDDVGAHFARRLDQAERDRLGHHRDQQCAAAWPPRRSRSDRRSGRGCRDTGRRRSWFRLSIAPRAPPSVAASSPGSPSTSVSPVKWAIVRADAAIMRVKAARQHRLAPLGDAPRHRDRFPAGGRAVVHRGIGDIGAEQPRDLGLELEQHLQRALRDLGLVGRVGGQELAALDQMIDAGGNMVAIGARAEEERHVARGQVLARSAAMWRSTAISLACSGRPAIGPSSRASAGTSTNRSSIDGRADGGEHCAAVVVGQRQITHELLRRRSWFGQKAGRDRQASRRRSRGRCGSCGSMARARCGSRHRARGGKRHNRRTAEPGFRARSSGQKKAWTTSPSPSPAVRRDRGERPGRASRSPCVRAPPADQHQPGAQPRQFDQIVQRETLLGVEEMQREVARIAREIGGFSWPAPFRPRVRHCPS